MKKIKNGSNKHTEILVYNQQQYYISHAGEDLGIPPGELGILKFQNGPIKEVGVNGCQAEDLLDIIIDRLSCFQTSDLACKENSIAIYHMKEALNVLNKRTDDRIKREVECTIKA